MIYLEQRSKTYKIGKLLAMMAYMESSFKNLLPTMKDWLSKWIEA